MILFFALFENGTDCPFHLYDAYHFREDGLQVS